MEKKTATTPQARDDLAKIAEFSGIAAPNEEMDFAKDFLPAIFAALFRSESWIAIVMITDLLARKNRFNVPGTTTSSNWTRRLHTTVAKLAGGRALRRQLRLVRELLENSGRAVVPSEVERSPLRPSGSATGSSTSLGMTSMSSTAKT